MSSRRPLQPMPAQSANVASTRYARNTTSPTAADGTLNMADPVLDDTQDSGSIVSGLTSLSGDDEFERLMIQKARDERRLNEALAGSRAQAFRKARTHARVGLTMDNLERNDKHNARAVAAGARVVVKSPPSSSGSARSDPPVYAPAGWGRKGRTSLGWMRGIRHEQLPQQSPASGEENGGGQHDGSMLSPLSHKSFNQDRQGGQEYQDNQGNQDYHANQGNQDYHANQSTPRNEGSGDWDLTFEMNEASMLVSTPYVPRNTKLDDIREREMESLREQGVASARLDSIRKSRPRSLHTSGAAKAEAQPQEQGSPTQRLRRRTNSWQSLNKSQPELGKENSPIAVYRKSVETVGVVEPGVVANAEMQTPRPFSKRSTDSQDLLRRLARVSNTPSPKETKPARPQTSPAPQPQPQPQPYSSSQTAVTETSTSHTKSEGRDDPTKAMPAEDTAQASTSTPQEQDTREQRHDTPHDGTTPDVPSSAPAAEEVDATPMPVERSVLQPKTPYVMGGWLDTPGPRTANKPAESRRERSQSPKRDTSKERSPERSAEQIVEEVGQPSPPRPRLPGSALHALVQEARANHDYGDDTLHSLEDLMTPRAENETEEDTLQDIPLPTTAPRNGAERLRNAEIEEVNRMNRRVRAAQSGIRDTSRGMRRLETAIEHIDVSRTGETGPVLVREFSPWLWFRSFFYSPRLKTSRVVHNNPLRIWGGVTLLGILLTVSFIWWASETVACHIYCHPEYASYSPYPFAVNMDAPQRGVVIPTLVYRALFKNSTTSIIPPVASLLSWIWTSLCGLTSSIPTTSLNRPAYHVPAISGPAMGANTQASWTVKEEIQEESSWDWSMAEDEVLRR